ncbi:NADPH-dependent F420 reductase [Herbidospora yilanensis]|uniref:NADPH-dependent F420 reductase n=1 Tax=Herbidospora yilanensis TaxID=354426 RepID=UPI000782F0ED|nr:NAD(P)-binding domain-containing protein [Herbidospora yilanensis]
MTGEPVGVVGCGSMGAAIAELLHRSGHRPILAGGTRRTAEMVAATLPGAVAADLSAVVARAPIVILATRLRVTCHVIGPLAARGLAGRIVVDVSNPDPGDLPPGGPRTSAELVADAFHKSAVVKALNCVSARRLRAVRPGDGLTVPIAGDDPGAKDAVTRLLGGSGLNVVDAGPLSASTWIESLAAFLRHLGTEQGFGDSVGFRLITPHEKGRPT